MIWTSRKRLFLWCKPSSPYRRDRIHGNQSAPGLLKVFIFQIAVEFPCPGAVDRVGFSAEAETCGPGTEEIGPEMSVHLCAQRAKFQRHHSLIKVLTEFTVSATLSVSINRWILKGIGGRKWLGSFNPQNLSFKPFHPKKYQPVRTYSSALRASCYRTITSSCRFVSSSLIDLGTDSMI
jgi:hypothetical protein